MAEAILRSFDKDLTIHSAGLSPVDHVSQIAIEVMDEIGINLEQKVPKSYKEFTDYSFDYLITVSEGTNIEFEIPDGIRFDRKLHLGFRSPYKGAKCQDEIRERCSEVRDEIFNELDYFYNRILKKSIC
jgi:arsenate reductase